MQRHLHMLRCPCHTVGPWIVHSHIPFCKLTWHLRMDRWLQQFSPDRPRGVGVPCGPLHVGVVHQSWSISCTDLFKTLSSSRIFAAKVAARPCSLANSKPYYLAYGLTWAPRPPRPGTARSGRQTRSPEHSQRRKLHKGGWSKPHCLPHGRGKGVKPCGTSRVHNPCTFSCGASHGNELLAPSEALTIRGAHNAIYAKTLQRYSACEYDHWRATHTRPASSAARCPKKKQLSWG